MTKAHFKTRWLLAGLLRLTFWLAPGAIYGQSRKALEAYNQANTLYGQGRYQEALPFAKKAVRLGEKDASRAFDGRIWG